MAEIWKKASKNRNLLWKRPLAAVALLLGLGGLSHSPACAESYRFVTLTFPPLEYQGKDGQPAGAAVEVVKTVMKRLGHEVEIDVLPWSRSIQEVRRAKAAAVFTAYKNEERVKFLDYSRQVLIPQVVSFYVRKGSGLDFHGDFAALKGKKVGVVSTISYGERFDEAVKNLNIETERVDKRVLNFKKLLAGRIDYVISNQYSAATVMKDLGLTDKIKKLEPQVEILPSYIAFSKKKDLESLRDAFDRELKKLKASGRYEEILEGFGVYPGMTAARNETP